MLTRTRGCSCEMQLAAPSRCKAHCPTMHRGRRGAACLVVCPTLTAVGGVWEPQGSCRACCWWQAAHGRMYTHAWDLNCICTPTYPQAGHAVNRAGPWETCWLLCAYPAAGVAHGLCPGIMHHDPVHGPQRQPPSWTVSLPVVVSALDAMLWCLQWQHAWRCCARLMGRGGGRAGAWLAAGSAAGLRAYGTRMPRSAAHSSVCSMPCPPGRPQEAILQQRDGGAVSCADW